jgi:ribosome biogenesis GTPase
VLLEDGKGRHTTTRRELILLPQGGILMDTPGMRELGMAQDDGGVDASFADVTRVAASWRFNDCRHEDEPGCAVRAAVAAGELSEERRSSYHELRAELAAAERRRDPAQAGRSKRRWKSINKSMRARLMRHARK